jgi:hypothetical protein
LYNCSDLICITARQLGIKEAIRNHSRSKPEGIISGLISPNDGTVPLTWTDVQLRLVGRQDIGAINFSNSERMLIKAHSKPGISSNVDKSKAVV